MAKSVSNCHVVLEPLLKTERKCEKKQCTTPCYVKLESIDRQSKEINSCKGEDNCRNNCNDLSFNGMPSSLLNTLESKSSSQEATPLVKKKANKSTVTIEPVTPHANIEFSVELKKVINERNILTSKTRSRVFEALDEIKTKHDEERRNYKRNHVLFEIINSEMKYGNQLKIIINFFMTPTQQRKLLKSDDFNTLFGNINIVYKINEELLQELDKGYDNIANAFSKIAPFLKLYSVYAYEFKNSIKVLQNARLLNPQFATFVENQETRPEVQNKLSALLITPIQRVPRYKLLLTTLYNLTRPSEKDFNNLSECLEKIEEAAEHINKVVDDQENMQRLLEFQRCLRSGEPNIIMPGRKLLKEGVLSKMPTDGSHSERMYVVLMSDIIVFSKMKGEEPKVNSLKCLSIYPLSKCKVIELLDKGCLRLICQEEELVVYHEQFSEIKKWIEKIKEVIVNHVNDRKTLRKESSSRRPVKRKDIHEYHEAGLSPGRPLKKRKLRGELEPTHQRDININKGISCSLFSPPSTPVIKGGLPTSKNTENPAAVKDLYVFGKSGNTGTRFGKFLGGVGSTIKKFLGFRN